ncbi:MAG TPA: prolyl oligopeptidase family serine peptidase [Sedimentisphaerales bacterium]|nr:prolyl oligopeptidase family serine peptidase [Sedimentisphaerales bacterium]
MRTGYLVFLAAVVLLAAPRVSSKEDVSADGVQIRLQQHKKFEKAIIKTIRCEYLIFLPEGYGRTRKSWPVILFLHGAGERGNDIEKLRLHGLPRIVETRKDFAFIVVSPQCPMTSWWPQEQELLINLVREVVKKYEVDTERIYLTGLSMGGFGTWSLACRYPDYFAAIAPICGGYEPFLAGSLKDVPVWAFHGAKDEVVPVSRSEDMVEAVNAAGGDAKLTVYPDAGHDAWTATYNNDELYKWFLEHRKKKKGN